MYPAPRVLENKFPHTSWPQVDAVVDPAVDLLRLLDEDDRSLDGKSKTLVLSCLVCGENTER